MNKSKINKIQIVLISIGLLFLTNCWYYSFKGTIPSHINSIAITDFENQSSETGIRESVTEQVKLGFIQENVLNVEDKENSDSILYGTIQGVDDEPYTYESSNRGKSVNRYKVVIKAQVEWYDNINDEQLFKNNITVEEPYDQTGASGKSREEALELAIETLNDDIISAVLTIW